MDKWLEYNKKIACPSSHLSAVVVGCSSSNNRPERNPIIEPGSSAALQAVASLGAQSISDDKKETPRSLSQTPGQARLALARSLLRQ